MHRLRPGDRRRRRALLARRSSNQYELTTAPGLENTLFGGGGLFLLRLTGQGKVWLQSLSLPLLAAGLERYLPQQQSQASLQSAGLARLSRS